MPITPVLDAHTFIWYLGGSSRLSAKAKQILDAAKDEIALPIIALAEAYWIAERRKAALSLADITNALNADLRITVIPLDRAILERSVSLTSIHEMHDRLIVATALTLMSQGKAVQLLTCDGNITASILVPVVW
jgi:PIN domain nuclease of toxin-antitoxin system